MQDSTTNYTPIKENVNKEDKMAIFSSNRDLDSTITVVGIHLLMGGAMFFHFTGMGDASVDSSIMSNLLIAYTGVCGYLFGKGKAEATAERKKEIE